MTNLKFENNHKMGERRNNTIYHLAKLAEPKNLNPIWFLDQNMHIYLPSPNTFKSIFLKYLFDS